MNKSDKSESQLESYWKQEFPSLPRLNKSDLLSLPPTLLDFDSLQGPPVPATEAFPTSLRNVVSYPLSVRLRRIKLECFRYASLDNVSPELVNGHCAASNASALTPTNCKLLDNMHSPEENQFLVRTLLLYIYIENAKAYAANLYTTASYLKVAVPDVYENAAMKRARWCFIRALEGKGKECLDNLTKDSEICISAVELACARPLEERYQRQIAWLRLFGRDYYAHMLSKGVGQLWKSLCIRFPEAAVQEWGHCGMKWLGMELDESGWERFLKWLFVNDRDLLFAANAPYHNVLHRFVCEDTSSR